MERLTDERAVIEPGAYLVSDDLLDDVPEIPNVPQDELYYRLGLIENVLGKNYDLDRLRELIKADREGRIAVFPCKPSDVTVYQLRNKKHALGMGVHPRHVGCARVWGNGKYELLHGGDVPCKDKDFGKTWFLKEDEAQAALKAMKERE